MSEEAAESKEKEILITESEFGSSGIEIVTDGTECHRIIVMPNLNTASE